MDVSKKKKRRIKGIFYEKTEKKKKNLGGWGMWGGGGGGGGGGSLGVGRGGLGYGHIDLRKIYSLMVNLSGLISFLLNMSLMIVKA